MHRRAWWPTTCTCWTGLVSCWGGGVLVAACSTPRPSIVPRAPATPWLHHCHVQARLSCTRPSRTPRASSCMIHSSTTSQASAAACVLLWCCGCRRCFWCTSAIVHAPLVPSAGSPASLFMDVDVQGLPRLVQWLNRCGLGAACRVVPGTARALAEKGPRARGAAAMCRRARATMPRGSCHMAPRALYATSRPAPPPHHAAPGTSCGGRSASATCPASLPCGQPTAPARPRRPCPSPKLQVRCGAPVASLAPCCARRSCPVRQPRLRRLSRHNIGRHAAAFIEQHWTTGFVVASNALVAVRCRRRVARRPAAACAGPARAAARGPSALGPRPAGGSGWQRGAAARAPVHAGGGRGGGGDAGR